MSATGHHRGGRKVLYFTAPIMIALPLALAAAHQLQPGRRRPSHQRSQLLQPGGLLGSPAAAAGPAGLGFERLRERQHEPKLVTEPELHGLRLCGQCEAVFERQTARKGTALDEADSGNTAERQYGTLQPTSGTRRCSSPAFPRTRLPNRDTS
eukprot:SAG22_NODE_6568_length_837_cov_1.210027_1_plen_153_part_00